MSQPVTRRRPAPPAGGTAGSTVGLVAFLVGLSGRDALPGVALRRLLGDLGMSDQAARAAISRMVRAGNLAVEKQGRTAAYRLDGSTARGFHFIRNRSGSGPAWDGTFHTVLHRVPERERPFRDALRHAATMAGYGVLQPGVLVAPRDYREQLAAVLADRSAGARVIFGRLTVDPGDAPDLIATAWGLDDVAAGYRTHVDALARVVDAGPVTDGREALRAFALTVAPALSATLGEPAVPPELLPPDWPGPELRRLTAECGELLGPAAGRYVATVLREASS